MGRTIIAIVGGLVGWIVVISLLNVGLRHLLPGYALAEPAMAFTLTQQLARLMIATLTSLTAGAMAVRVAPASARAPLALGIVLVLVFVPVHLRIWAHFPLWYHATFLLSLAPLVLLGGRLARTRAV